MAVIDISRVETVEAFEQLRPDWDRLLSQSDVNNIFLTFDWIKSWWETFGEQFRLYILLIKEGDKLIGIAPLMLTLRKSIRFIGTPNADYGDLIGPDKDVIIKQVFSYLTKHNDEWNKIDLQQIPAKSGTLTALNTLLEARSYKYQINQMETCFSYQYEGSEEDRGLFTLRRNKTMRRKFNFFMKAGGLELIRLQDSSEIKEYLPSFFHGHIVRWDQTSTPSKFLNPKNRDFYYTLVNNLARQKQISMLMLMHKNRPIAYYFTFDYNNSLFLYTTIFDPFYFKRSPGYILIDFLTTDFIRNGYNIIDHTRGDEFYKESFTNKTSVNYRLTIYKHSRDLALARFKTRIRQSGSIQKLAQNQYIGDLKAKLSAYRAHHGTGHLFMTILKKLLILLFEYKVMFVLDHNHKPPPLKLPPEVTIGQVGQEDFGTIASFVGIDPSSRKHGMIMKRFADGGECFVARYKGTIASIAWGIFKEDHLFDVDTHFPLKENQVFLADAYTSPIFRGLGLHPLLIAHRLHRYHNRKLKILTTCMKNNVSSLKGIRKTGFEYRNRFHYLKILRKRII
ncbi:MAG: GNAT family N-acetyltransferase [FCB group bacterium]|nr:GNAT family N-acetyltransferase [FCB group bacterium]